MSMDTGENGAGVRTHVLIMIIAVGSTGVMSTVTRRP